MLYRWFSMALSGKWVNDKKTSKAISPMTLHDITVKSEEGAAMRDEGCRSHLSLTISSEMVLSPGHNEWVQREVSHVIEMNRGRVSMSPWSSHCQHQPVSGLSCAAFEGEWNGNAPDPKLPLSFLLFPPVFFHPPPFLFLSGYILLSFTVYDKEDNDLLLCYRQ